MWNKHVEGYTLRIVASPIIFFDIDLRYVANVRGLLLRDTIERCRILMTLKLNQYKFPDLVICCIPQFVLMHQFGGGGRVVSSSPDRVLSFFIRD